MNIAPFSIKQGDLAPALRVQLLYTDRTLPNLTNAASVNFKMRSRSDGRVLVDANAAIIDALQAIVEYAWAAGNTDVVDSYDTEWTVTWNDGTQQTFPSEGFGRVDVGERL